MFIASSVVSTEIFGQHKMGADRPETFQAVSVDPQSRMVDLGPPKEIEVR